MSQTCSIMAYRWPTLESQSGKDGVLDTPGLMLVHHLPLTSAAPRRRCQVNKDPSPPRVRRFIMPAIILPSSELVRSATKRMEPTYQLHPTSAFTEKQVRVRQRQWYIVIRVPFFSILRSQVWAPIVEILLSQWPSLLWTSFLQSPSVLTPMTLF